MMKSLNPALNENVFRNEASLSSSKSMTIQGTVNKTALLLVIVIATAAITWNKFFNGVDVNGLMIIGGIVGLISALITIFKKNFAHITAPIYAASQGLFLGGLSAFFEMKYPGIVIQAIGLTFCTLFSLLAAYKSGVIRATENFKLGVFAATGALGVFYILSFVLSMFGINIPLIHSNGIFGIGFSVFVVVIAALNLVMDFDFIESGERMGAPKHMEWYSAFGLMVTLIWLYIEVLRLLAKLQSRRD